MLEIIYYIDSKTNKSEIKLEIEGIKKVNERKKIF